MPEVSTFSLVSPIFLCLVELTLLPPSESPQTIYPLAHLIPTLQRLVPPFPPTSASAPSPLLPLLIPLTLLSQKYRRRLPPLLPSLLHASSSSLPPDLHLEGIDEKEWKALRTGLSIWMGSRPPPASSSYSRGGGRGHQRGAVEIEGDGEQQLLERVRLEKLREEERKLVEGKKWLEGLERRE